MAKWDWDWSGAHGILLDEFIEKVQVNTGLSRKQICARIPNDERTVRYWIAGETSPAAWKIIRLLGWDCDSREAANRFAAEIQRRPELKEKLRNVIKIQLSDGSLKKIKDLKNVIEDPPISARLLKGRDLPPLHECIEATRTVQPTKDEEKNRPLIPGFTFNHFFQPSCVILLSSADKPTSRVLAYNRDKDFQKNPAQCKHTQGWAVLWAASYCHAGASDEHYNMEDWIYQARENRNVAARLFCGPCGKAIPTMALLLWYKLRLNELLTTPELEMISSRPLGLISNDQRQLLDPETKQPLNRVYSQYVFELSLRTTKNPDDYAFLMSLLNLQYFWAEPELLDPTDSSFNPEAFFVNSKKGTKNAMDILVWKARLCDGPLDPVDTATFVRGFEIV